MANCPVCRRNHGPEMPCPKRLAQAIMMKPGALEALTQVDKNWLSENKFDVTEILEAELANRL